MMYYRSFIGFLIAIAWPAAPAAAQACLGVPTRDAQFNVRAELALPDNARQYAGVLTADLRGPLSFELNAGLIDFEDAEGHGASFGGRLAYEVERFRTVSLCPLAGAQYTRLETDELLAGEPFQVEGRTLVLATGIGVGVALGAQPAIVLYAQPQFVHVRSRFRDDPLADEDRRDANELAVEAGARVALGRVLLGGGVNWTTIEDADPVFSITAGVTFGR